MSKYGYPLSGSVYANRDAIKALAALSKDYSEGLYSGSSLPIATVFSFHEPMSGCLFLNTGNYQTRPAHVLARLSASIHGEILPNTEISVVNIRGFGHAAVFVSYTTYSAYHQDQPINHNFIPGTSLASQATNIVENYDNFGAMRLGAIYHFDPNSVCICQGWNTHRGQWPNLAYDGSSGGFVMEADISLRGKILHVPLHFSYV